MTATGWLLLSATAYGVSRWMGRLQQRSRQQRMLEMRTKEILAHIGEVVRLTHRSASFDDFWTQVMPTLELLGELLGLIPWEAFIFTVLVVLSPEDKRKEIVWNYLTDTANL